MKKKFAFAISVGTNKWTGDIMSVYFQVRRAKAAETREICNGAAFANYNDQGELIGIEMLAPCKASALMKITTDPSVKKFVRGGIPRQMELTAK